MAAVVGAHDEAAPAPMPSARLGRALGTPVDPASVAVFRIGFGLLAVATALRFVALGWVEELLVEPAHLFHWFPWVVRPTAPVLYGLFAVQAVAGLGIASGRATRSWLGVWLLSFGYVELLDKALYLNHYVLFTLLGVWLLVIPIGRASLSSGAGLPAWALWLLRVQVGSVYLWAGIAKLNADWLLRAEPLATWLGARVDMPVLGPLLALDGTAWVMSWAGAAYDLSIPFLLLWRRTRGIAMVLVVVFHTVVGVVFPIGIFPWVMILSATLFLDPSWPRGLLGRPAVRVQPATSLRPVAVLGWLVVTAAIALVPGRGLLSEGSVSWHERGHRFAWRVLLNEKTGMVDYRVVEPATGRVWHVAPSEELTCLQHTQMRTQPDMIRDYALHLRDVHAGEGRAVRVYADAFGSLNGRPTQRLIRPDVELTQPIEALERQSWVVPLGRFEGR